MGGNERVCVVWGGLVYLAFVDGVYECYEAAC